MPVFQVLSRTAQLSAPPKKRPRRIPYPWYVAGRFIIVVGQTGGLFALLTIFRGHSDAIFILLPVFLSFATAQFQGYNFNALLRGTPIYLFLTFCLAFVYYSAVIIIVLLIHQNPAVSHIILIATALAWGILLEPLRILVQKRIERRFNRRDRETIKAVGAFTSTLREEIDLAQLRERFLTVIRQLIQPYSASFWTRIPGSQSEPTDALEEVSIADDDPLLAYMLRYPGVLEMSKLQLDSPALQELQLRRTEVLLPLASQGELIGMLTLGPHLRGQDYTHEELTLLDTLAPQVAPALRVAQLVQEQQAQVREHERIEQELRTAQAIQHAFLPKVVPAFPGWQLAPYYQSAREVGGDFYDFFPFEDGRLGLVIGDVTGKGVPAALVMATVHTMLRSTVQETSSPGEVFARVNELLAAEIPAGMFVTCFYAILNPQSGCLHYANAGHEPPYHHRANGASELDGSGMPLGMLPGTRYDEYEATLAPGESLLFYSDGLVEAHNPERVMFGFPRLTAVIAASPGDSSLIDLLMKELTAFTGDDWEQEDDVTIVTLHRVSPVAALNAQG